SVFAQRKCIETSASRLTRFRYALRATQPAESGCGLSGADRRRIETWRLGLDTPAMRATRPARSVRGDLAHVVGGGSGRRGGEAAEQGHTVEPGPLLGERPWRQARVEIRDGPPIVERRDEPRERILRRGGRRRIRVPGQERAMQGV